MIQRPCRSERNEVEPKNPHPCGVARRAAFGSKRNGSFDSLSLAQDDSVDTKPYLEVTL